MCPPNVWFSAPAVGSKLFFSKILTYKRACSSVKLTVMHARRSAIMLIGPMANWECQVISPDWVFGTIFKPLSQPLVTLGI